MISTSNLEKIASLFKKTQNPLTSSYTLDHRNFLRKDGYLPYFYRGLTDYSLPTYMIGMLDKDLKLVPGRPNAGPNTDARILCEHPSLPSRAIIMLSTNQAIYEDIRKTILPLKRTLLRKTLKTLGEKHNIQYASIKRMHVYVQPLNTNPLIANFTAYDKYVK